MATLHLIFRTHFWSRQIKRIARLSWGGGLFRLWVLATILFWIVLLLRMRQTYTDPNIVMPPGSIVNESEVMREYRTETIPEMIWDGVFWPGLALLIGHAIGWVGRGFIRGQG